MVRKAVGGGIIMGVVLDTVGQWIAGYLQKEVPGYEPFTPDEDLVPNVADFGKGYHIHVTGLIHDDTGFPVGSPARRSAAPASRLP